MARKEDACPGRGITLEKFVVNSMGIFQTQFQRLPMWVHESWIRMSGDVYGMIQMERGSYTR